METLNRYLAELAGELPRDPQLRELIVAEVADHLRSRAQELERGGLGPGESMRRAVEQFGPAGQVGAALARVHRRASWREALAGGLPHLLAALTVGLPALPLAVGGPYLQGWRGLLELAFAAAVLGALAWNARRYRLWVSPWIGYGLVLAFGLAQTLFHGLGVFLWLPLGAAVYLWLARRDRLAGVLAATPLVPMAWTWLALDEVAPALAAPLIAGVGLLVAAATAAAIRVSEERRGIVLLAAANALAWLPVSYATVFRSPYPAILVGFGGRLTFTSVGVSAGMMLAASTVLLLGPLWFSAAAGWLWGRVRGRA